MLYAHTMKFHHVALALIIFVCFSLKHLASGYPANCTYSRSSLENSMSRYHLQPDECGRIFYARLCCESFRKRVCKQGKTLCSESFATTHISQYGTIYLSGYAFEGPLGYAHHNHLSYQESIWHHFQFVTQPHLLSLMINGASLGGKLT